MKFTMYRNVKSKPMLKFVKLVRLIKLNSSYKSCCGFCTHTSISVSKFVFSQFSFFTIKKTHKVHYIPTEYLS